VGGTAGGIGPLLPGSSLSSGLSLFSVAGLDWSLVVSSVLKGVSGVSVAAVVSSVLSGSTD